MRKHKRRARSAKIIEDLYDNPADVLIIHYSCENFYVIDAGKTPRITSIAIRGLNTGQTKSFSMHIVAEIKKIPINEIEKNYDEIEKVMLEEYYSFVEEHKKYKWVHWKMRDANYGFDAIDNRYKVLGGIPISIDDDKKFQLSELLKDKYSSKYINKPRFYKLLEKNKMNKRHLLDGETECQCFDNKEHIRIHKSTLSKVEALEYILIKAAENSLKTDSVFWARHGYSAQGIFQWAKENYLGAIIFAIIGMILKQLISLIFK